VATLNVDGQRQISTKSVKEFFSSVLTSASGMRSWMNLMQRKQNCPDQTVQRCEASQCCPLEVVKKGKGIPVTGREGP
jgi:hypothetical protein